MIVLTGDPARWTGPEAGSAVAIGVFDGVHRGHQAVLQALDAAPEGSRRVALTFGVHPAAVLAPTGPPPLITPLQRRIDLLGVAGADAVAILHFDDAMRRLTPDEFIERYVVRGLDARLVAVGEDFRFGQGAAGGIADLRRLGAEHGFVLAVVPILRQEAIEIRSTAIRDALHRGNVVAAAGLLGRPHEIEGAVVPVDHHTPPLGIRTTAIEPLVPTALPADGVYVAVVTIDGVLHPGVVDIGTDPDGDGEERMVEVHVSAEVGDVSGATVRVGFLDRLRSEPRSDSADALVAQIRTDIDAARDVNERYSPIGDAARRTS